MTTPDRLISAALDDHLRAIDELRRTEAVPIVEAARRMISSLLAGGKVLVFGNGGSAADAQHFAAELVGRYRRERRGWPAIALTTDTSAMTAIGNDYGFDEVFARQVRALAAPGDVALGLSTSGNSENVIRALVAAGERGAFRIALTGRTGGRMTAHCDLLLAVPADDTPRIQETHITILHILCDLIESELHDGDPR